MIEECKFQFSPSVIELAGSRSGERFIQQWQEDSEVAALNQNEAADHPSPAVRAAVQVALQNLNRYPDHRAARLREKLATKLGVSEGQLIFGNGSYEIIAMLCQVVLQRGSEMAVPEPTYRRYFESAVLAGAKYRPIPLRNDGSNDPAKLASAAARSNVVVVCTPNNPTGAPLTSEELRQISDAIPSHHLLIVDEAYGDFSRAVGGLDAVEELKNSSHPWVVIRTLSKAHGLAGLRFGFAVTSHQRIADMVEGVRGLFNVGRLVQAAALAAINDEERSAAIIRRTIAERERLRVALQDMGLTSMPSATNFLAVHVGRQGKGVQEYLRSKDILVATIPGERYQEYIRISVGTEHETDRVVEALANIQG